MPRKELPDEVEAKLWDLQRRRANLHTLFLGVSNDVRLQKERLLDVERELSRLTQHRPQSEHTRSMIEATERQLEGMRERLGQLQREEAEAKARWQPAAQLATACEKFLGVEGR